MDPVHRPVECRGQRPGGRGRSRRGEAPGRDGGARQARCPPQAGEREVQESVGASTMTKALEGKVALVTGGSRGIGAAIAKRLGADGASVAFTYASAQGKADEVVKVIETAGGRALAIRADSADVQAVRGAVAETVRSFGRLDVLV